MRTYTGGETVEPGLYFDARQLAFRSVDVPGALPGEGGAYRRVPTALLLLVGPMLGLAYAIFLPFAGMAMAASLLGVKAVRVAQGAAREAVRVVRPGWEPSMAFLSRSRPTRTSPEASDAWAESVRKKLESMDRVAS